MKAPIKGKLNDNAKARIIELQQQKISQSKIADMVNHEFNTDISKGTVQWHASKAATDNNKPIEPKPCQCLLCGHIQYH